MTNCHRVHLHYYEITIHSLFLVEAVSNIMWIGLTDIDKENMFVWVDGTKSSYRNWETVTEPNNANGNEHCVYMTKDGKWWDVSCNRLYPFLCKMVCPFQTMIV